MNPPAELPARGSGDLNRQLTSWIEQRTGGRVHCLRVEKPEVGEGRAKRFRIVIHGCAGSHHIRQLALAAALEVLESPELERVELQMEVEVRR